MGRAPCCDKANVKKGSWSPDEDAKLKAYIEEHGTGGNWIALPQKIGLKRCGKSCRLRWLNYLRPNIKHGDFSEEEDFIICSLYISIGSRWSIIAAQLPGRTDNDIKNYWNTKLKKKFLGKKRDSSTARHKSQQATLERSEKAHARLRTLNHEKTSESMTASALERMQLHLKLQGRLRNTFSFLNNYQSRGFDEMITGPLAVLAGTDIGQGGQQITLGMQSLTEELDFSNFVFHSSNSDPSVSCAVSLDHSSSCSNNHPSEAAVKFELNNGLLDGSLCEFRGQTINWEKEIMDSWGRNDDFKEETILSGPWDLSAVFRADSTIQEWQQI